MSARVAGRRRGGDMDEDANRLLTGVAWREWCDRLRAAGDQILDSDAPSDDRSRIEGYRALTRLLGHATRQEIEASDPLFPDFVRYGEPHSQWGGPNPNIAYLRAVIDPHETYRIWADVDGLVQAIFSQHEGDVQLDEHGVYHERHLDSLEIDNEGFLEIVLSPDEHDENWIPTHPDARFFAIRLFVSDWENHTAPTFHIERIGAEGEAPAPRSASEFAEPWTERSPGSSDLRPIGAKPRATISSEPHPTSPAPFIPIRVAPTTSFPDVVFGTSKKTRR